MAKAVLVIKSAVDETPATLEDKLLTDVGQQSSMVHDRLAQYLQSVGSGPKSGKTIVRIDSETTVTTLTPLANAAPTVTCASVTATGDTVSIGKAVFTWTVTASTSTQVDIGASTTAMATNFASKVNAYSMTKGLVVASASASVVTLTWKGAGREGAMVTLEETGSSCTVSATSFAPGTTLDGQTTTAVSFAAGLA